VAAVVAQGHRADVGIPVAAKILIRGREQPSRLPSVGLLPPVDVNRRDPMKLESRSEIAIADDFHTVSRPATRGSLTGVQLE
jgi:hypothetical protein